MGINGIASNYFSTGYLNNKAVKAESGKNFVEIASRKAAEADQEKMQEKPSKVLDLIGANAPDEVRQAWTEAEKEMGGWFTAGGSWVSADGKHSHMTQMGVQTGLKWAKGELEQADLLGNSVQSAINAVNKWIYDIDNPLPGQLAKSMEEQREIMKERAFYVAFLDQLKNLAGQEEVSVTHEKNFAETVQDRASAAFDTIGAHAPDKVKQAWIEAVEETGTNVSFSHDEEGFHIPLPQLMVQRVVRWLKGEVDPGNLLGNSVESAISVIEKAIYDIDYPLPGSPARSIEEQKDTKKERAFYVAFLEKLKQLS